MRSLLLLPLLCSAGWAIDASSQLIDWSQLGLSEAREDAQARGPELLHAAADGRLALYDSVGREVLLLDAGQPGLSFPVHFAADLLLVEQGVVVLDSSTRRLGLWSWEGRLLAGWGLPPLVPTAVTLVREGDQILAQDIFGQAHPVATLRHGDLLEPVATGLQRRPDRVLWDGAAMRTEGLELELPGALEASGQRIGDWLVVDAVVADLPLQVTRTAWHIPSRQHRDLPVAGRLYAPRGDLAATPEGDLLVLVPKPAGLELLRVSP
jgi:hypothetical protein